MKQSPRYLALALASLSALFVGCAGGGYGYGQPGGGYGQVAPGGAPAAGPDLQTAILTAIIQSMAGSVMNGQVGSRLAPADRDFRLQQLAGATHAGGFNQAQQWSNPQTGAVIGLKPLGQQIVDPYTRQTCRDLEETYTRPDGQAVRETRRACQSPDGKWRLVQ